MLLKDPGLIARVFLFLRSAAQPFRVVEHGRASPCHLWWLWIFYCIAFLKESGTVAPQYELIVC